MTTEKMYNQYYSEVFNYIKWKINSISDAEEVANDVFIKADRLNKDEKTRYNPEKCQVKTWLLTITNSAIIDYFRTNHKDRYVNVGQFCDAETGKELFQFVDNSNANSMENQELQVRLTQAFKTLKPKYRSIAYLFFLKEKPYNEIAEICNVPMGTVKGTLARAKEMLQKELKTCNV